MDSKVALVLGAGNNGDVQVHRRNRYLSSTFTIRRHNKLPMVMHRMPLLTLRAKSRVVINSSKLVPADLDVYLQ